MISAHICPHCQSANSVVNETLPRSQTEFLQRRRQCRKCRRSWSTIEIHKKDLDEIRHVTRLYLQLIQLLEPFRDENSPAQRAKTLHSGPPLHVI